MNIVWLSYCHYAEDVPDLGFRWHRSARYHAGTCAFWVIDQLGLFLVSSAHAEQFYFARFDPPLETHGP